jgi:hypothetical protein
MTPYRSASEVGAMGFPEEDLLEVGKAGHAVI